MPLQQPIGRVMTKVVATLGTGILLGTIPLLIILGTTTDGMIPGITPPGAGDGMTPGTTTTPGVGAGTARTITATIVAVTTVVDTTSTIRAITITAIQAPSLVTVATAAVLPADVYQTTPAQADSMVLVTVPMAPQRQGTLLLLVLPIALYRAVLHVLHQRVAVLIARLAARRQAAVLSATPAVPMAAAVHQAVAVPLAAAVLLAAVTVHQVAMHTVVAVLAVDADRSEKC